MKAIIRPGEIADVKISMTYESDDVRIFYLDSSSKRYCISILRRPNLDSLNGSMPIIILYADQNTIHINESLRGVGTEIEISDMDDWEFISLDQSKYEAHIVYIRNGAKQYNDNSIEVEYEKQIIVP